MLLDILRPRYFKLNKSFFNWIFISLNDLIWILIFFQWHKKNKGCPNLPFWFTNNVSSKLLGDYLTNVQPETNTFWIYLTCLFQISKQFKQLLLIFLLYSNAWILYNNLNNTVLCIFQNFYKTWLFWVW